MKRKFIKGIIPIILMVLITGCTANTGTVNIIDKPFLDSEYEGILEALAKEDKVITVPLEENSSSITPLYNSSDGNTYIVTYLQGKEKGASFQYGIAMFKKGNSGWQKIKEITIGDGDWIDKVEVKDLNGDENKEILVNTEFINGKPGTLKVITLSEGTFRDYGNFSCVDFTINGNIIDKKNTFTILNDKGDNMELSVSEITGDSVSGILSTTFVDNGGRYFVEGGSTGEDSQGIYIYNMGGKLGEDLKVVVNADNVLYDVVKPDILKGIIEKETLKEMVGVEKSDNGETLIAFTSDLTNLDKDSLKVTKYFSIDPQGNMELRSRIFKEEERGFRVKLPLGLGQNIMIKSVKKENSQGAEYAFILAEGTKETEIFGIKCLSKGEKNEGGEYKKLKSSPVYDFYYSIKDGQKIKEKDVEDSFKLIERE